MVDSQTAKVKDVTLIDETTTVVNRSENYVIRGGEIIAVCFDDGREVRFDRDESGA